MEEWEDTVYILPGITVAIDGRVGKLERTRPHLGVGGLPLESFGGLPGPGND